MIRKQAETDRLRQRIASLEKAVEGMSNEFIEFGDRLVSSSGISWNAQLLDDLKGTTGRFLDYARTAESLANEEEGASTAASESLQPSGVSTTPTALGSTPWCLPERIGLPMPFEFSTLFPSPETQPVAPLLRSPKRAGHFSPRLGYGLLSDNTSQLTAAETLMNHYFVAGPNSFAIRLYKDTIILVIRVLRGEISIPGFIPSIFRYRSRYEKYGDFLADVSSFMERMSLEDSATEDPVEGVSDSENESSLVLFGLSHPVMTSPLRATIQNDMVQENGSLGEWFDPWNTQLYLQKQWGFELTASTARLAIPKSAPQTMTGDLSESFSEDLFQTAVEPWYGSMQEAQEAMDRGESWFAPEKTTAQTSNPVLLVQPLAERLIKSAVCFGEGPRFIKGNINVAANEFLARMNDSRQAFGIPS